jgi:hypothetical protein
MSAVSSSGLSSFLPQQAAALKGNQIQMQVQVAVMKQTMDQSKAAGEALVKMIQSANNGLGGHYDVRA